MSEIKLHDVGERKSFEINKNTENNLSKGECDNHWQHVREKLGDKEEKIEACEPDKFYTTDEQREEHLPKDGQWTGVPGESKFISNNQEANEVLKKYGLDGIEYKNKIPDFSNCTIVTAKIDKMTPFRSINRNNFYKALVESGKFENIDQIREFKQKYKLAFHECSDRHTCQFVDERIHSTFKHSGGRMECRIRDGINTTGGSKFDD